jgi:hypothetical protein
VRPSEEGAAKDRVGSAVCDRLEEGRQILGIVFQIRILHHDDVAGGMSQRRPNGCAFALVCSMRDRDIHRPVAVQQGQHFTTAIARSIIDAYDFHRGGGSWIIPARTACRPPTLGA